MNTRNTFSKNAYFLASSIGIDSGEDVDVEGDHNKCLQGSLVDATLDRSKVHGLKKCHCSISKEVAKNSRFSRKRKVTNGICKGR